MQLWYRCLAWCLPLLGIAVSSLEWARAAEPRLRVLVDSYHAHNFLHLGLKPGQFSYHQYTSLRRACSLLENRGCEIEELIVGPITAVDLARTHLLVINLVSMDRPPFLVSEIRAIVDYVKNGGGIVFITDHSNCYYHQYRLLPLWVELGLIPTFETVCERDPANCLSSSGNAWTLIRQFGDHPVTRGLKAIAMQASGRVQGQDQLAFTGESAWADTGALPLYGEGDPGGLYGDFLATDAEDQGKQGVVLAKQVGNGRVVVIADQNCVGDAFIAFAQNWQLWINAARWCGRLDYRKATTLSEQKQSIAIHCFDPLGTDPLGTDPLGTDPLGTDPLGTDPLGTDPLGTDPLGTDPLGTDPLGTEPLHTNLMGSHASVSEQEYERDELFDFAAQDVHQYHNFWVWLNRRYWVSCGHSRWRPQEFDEGRWVLIGRIERLEDDRFAKACEDCVANDGVAILLSLKDTQREAIEQMTMLKLGQQKQFVNLVAASLHANEARTFSSKKDQHQPLSMLVAEIHADGFGRKGEIWLVSGANVLRNDDFRGPSRQPTPQQVGLQDHISETLLKLHPPN